MEALSQIKVLFLVIVIALLSTVGTGQNNNVDSVVKYNTAQFKKEVPTKNHFVFYFAPW